MAYQMMQNYAPAAQHTNYLNSLIGHHVKVNRGGPDALTGRLLAVHSNYLVLQTKTGVVYVNAAHVKSITETAGGTGGRSTTYIVAENFNGVLRQLRQQFVQINQGGPEKVAGFVVEVTNDTLLLVSNKEAIRIPLHHIRSVSVVQQKGNKSNGNTKSGENHKSGGNKSNGNRTHGERTGGNRTGGNRTGGKRSGGNRTGGNRTGGKHTGGAQGSNTLAQARAHRKSAAGSRRTSR